MANGAMDEAGDVGRCRCPETLIPEPWDAAYHHWYLSSRAVQGRWYPCAGPSVRAAGDTARARPTAPWMGMAVAAPLAVAPREEAASGPGAGSVPRGMAAGGHGGGGRRDFGREPCPGGARCRAGRGGSHCRRQGTTVALHPIPLCPAPARRDVALPGCACHLLRLRELGLGDSTH